MCKGKNEVGESEVRAPSLAKGKQLNYADALNRG
jgi:hypothetical protein